MSKRTIPLKIRGCLRDLDHGLFRYEFRIDPLVHDGKAFLFFRYALECDLKNKHCRKEIAADLRKKHAAAWRRYHDWKEARE